MWDSLTDGVAEAGFETVAGMATKYYYNTEKYVDIRTYFDRQWLVVDFDFSWSKLGG